MRDRRRSFEGRLTSLRLSPFWLLGLSGGGTSSWCLGFVGRRCTGAFLDTAPQRIHKVDNVCRLSPLGPLDRLAFLLLFEQVLQGVLIPVIEVAGVEVPFLGFHDVRGKIEHILGDLFIGNVVKIILFLSNLVRVPQRHAEQPLAARFKCNDVLARREYDLSDSDHTLFPDGFPDHGERLLTNLAVRGDVIRAVQIQFVDFVPWHELIDVDCALALDRDGLQLLGIDLDVLVLADFVPLDDVGRIDFVPGLRVNPTVFDAVASALVELMEADLLSL